MDDVINCFHLGVNVVFLPWPWEHSRNRDHTAIGITSEMTAKRYFSYVYGCHLEMCHTYIFYLIIIGFLDPENIRIYTKIVFLIGLQVNTSPKTDCCVAILFLPSKKFLKVPSWHLPDSDSVSVQDDESIIKVHNDTKTRFSWIWPFGIWTNAGLEDSSRRDVFNCDRPWWPGGL